MNTSEHTLQRWFTAMLFAGMSFLLSSCELITLGGGSLRQRLPDLDQNSAQGVVYLFKTELDSNNVYAALHVLSSDDRPLLAIEKYDMQEEIARMGRMIAGKKITYMKIDTLSEVKHRIKTEFNYTKELTFTTVKIEDAWFIAAIKE